MPAVRETTVTQTARFTALLAVLLMAACASKGHAPTAATTANKAPAKTASTELMQFGRFVGQWSCTVQQRQADGSWQTQAGEAQWRWTYTLGGHAVQDYWQPADATANPTGLGTNLRTWDRDTQQWDVVWATATQQGLETLGGRVAGPNMVLEMTKQGRANRPGHLARITFFDIQAEQFDWIYEASPIDDGQQWSALVQMRCTRS
ncbi:hypothetical protein GYB61_11540 [bacterium]|nr:hypothetical protein [bacterium]